MIFNDPSIPLNSQAVSKNDSTQKVERCEERVKDSYNQTIITLFYKRLICKDMETKLDIN